MQLQINRTKQVEMDWQQVDWAGPILSANMSVGSTGIPASSASLVSHLSRTPQLPTGCTLHSPRPTTDRADFDATTGIFI